jgi:hypothetical protein
LMKHAPQLLSALALLFGTVAKVKAGFLKLDDPLAIGGTTIAKGATA